MTRSTFGSELIRSTRSGNSASLTAPYGVSPMTATVYSSLDPSLIGFPVVNDAPAGATSGVTGACSVHESTATHAGTRAIRIVTRRRMEVLAGGVGVDDYRTLVMTRALVAIDTAS